MEVVIRGVRNVFRNATRSLAVVLILTVVICFSLVMLISLRAVNNKVDSVQSSIGTTITISPAGSRGTEGGGEPITTDDIAKIKATPHVSSVITSLADRAVTGTDTNLVSAIDPGTLGQRFNRNRSGSTNSNAPAAPPATLKLPITVTGTSDPSNIQVQGISTVTLTSGKWFDGASSANDAVIGTTLATKNTLVVGSTFTLHDATFTVVGIEDAGNQFANNGVIIPITTLQNITTQAGQVTSVYAVADNLSNLSDVQTALTSSLGTKVDITSQIDQANQALQPLQNIQSISLYSLIGALVAGTVIILLTMVMIVRERRKEVGVLKAIGASNFLISTQFMVESFTMSIIGAVAGTIAGVFLSTPVLNALLNNASASTASTAAGPGGFGGAARGFASRFGGQAASAFNIKSIQANVGWNILGYGLLIALAIALIGTLFPTLLITRVRPADVIRGE